MASTSAPFNRENALYTAQLAEQANDFKEVVAQMKSVATKVAQMTADERKMFQRGYGNYLTFRRDSWKQMARREMKEEAEGNDVTLIKEYKLQIEMDITNICAEVLSILNERLVPSSTSYDTFVFYYTMKGDYYRYRAEIKNGMDKQEDINLARKSYEMAMDAAVAKLPRAHPVRLGLDLNLAVFHHDVLGDTNGACQIADKTFDEATPGLIDLSEQDRKESNYWLSCLNDNMTLWSRISSKEPFNL